MRVIQIVPVARATQARPVADLVQVAKARAETARAEKEAPLTVGSKEPPMPQRIVPEMPAIAEATGPKTRGDLTATTVAETILPIELETLATIEAQVPLATAAGTTRPIAEA
jgi:hypothetical protein